MLGSMLVLQQITINQRFISIQAKQFTMFKPQNQCPTIRIINPNFNQEYFHYCHATQLAPKGNFQNALRSNIQIKTSSRQLNSNKLSSNHSKSESSLLKRQIIAKIHEEKADICKDKNLGKNNQIKSKQKEQRVSASYKDKKPILSAKEGQPKSQYYQSQPHDKNDVRKQQISKWKSTKTHLSKQLIKIEEVTFSMDSTQPQTDQKQVINQYQLPIKPQSSTNNKYQQTSNPFITVFRKKLIQKQIEEKERVYRHYIRSQSRSKEKDEKCRIKSRMKQVLNEMYELKKLIRE